MTLTIALGIAGGRVVPKPTVKKSCRLTDMQGLLRVAWLTAAQLALLYGVSERTIHRDLLDLQSEPIRAPVVDDGEKPLRYHITGGREKR